MTAAENMALDDVLLELKGEGRTPDTIRFLQFKPRAVLVGYHQSVAEEMRVDYCRAQGIDVNRRNTGGGAIFFDENQLGWEVICRKAVFDVGVPNPRLFRTLCLPVVDALAILGAPPTSGRATTSRSTGARFPVREARNPGRPSSSRARCWWISTWTRCCARCGSRSKSSRPGRSTPIKERVTCLRWVLGRTPPLSAIKDAVRRGFESRLGIRLAPSGLTAEETERSPGPAAALPLRGVDRPGAAARAAAREPAGGLQIRGRPGALYPVARPAAQPRARALHHRGLSRLSPHRALYDLETALRGADLDPAALRRTIQGFFDDGALRIPGMSAAEFVRPLDRLFQKLAIARTGLPLADCDRISPTNGTFAERHRTAGPRYCCCPTAPNRPTATCAATSPAACAAGTTARSATRGGPGRTGACGWRRSSASRTSGRELMRMRADGEAAFVGCCCRPFFTKHAEDFERAGVPGILLDIDHTTCYDLGQARDAYAGGFDRQTDLAVDLLDRVLGAADRVTRAPP